MGEIIMPYILKKLRGLYNGYIRNITNILNSQKSKAGNTCYVIYKTVLDTKPKCFDDYCMMIGVLECAKLEFYRKHIAKYEEEKIIENGDVY